MKGKLQLQITAADFAKGSSSSDYAQDGGFSPSSVGLNLNIKEGVVYSMTQPVDASTNLAGVIIASCENKGGAISTNRRNFLDSSANFYTLAGTTLTKQATGTKTYTYGLSDMTPFQEVYYASSLNDVTQWSGTTITSETWFTSVSGSFGALSSAPHPLLVYNKKLFIGDGNYLHMWDGTTLTTEQLSLNLNEVIYALGIDPGTGLMLISTRGVPDASLAISSPSFVYLFDGASRIPSRRIPTNDLALSFRSIGETVYIGMSRGIGIWTGAGISLIHQFQTVKYDADFLPYKAHLTNIGDVLYFVDNKQIFAYTTVQQANNLWMRAVKVFYPCFLPVGRVPASYIGLITDIGAGALGVYFQTSTPTNILSIYDTTTGGLGGIFYSNRNEFPRPVFIYRMRVFTTGFTNSSLGGQVGIRNDQDGNSYVPTQSQMSTAGTQSVFDFDLGGYKCQMAQFLVTLGVSGLGLNRLVVYYDIAE